MPLPSPCSNKAVDFLPAHLSAARHPASLPFVLHEPLPPPPSSPPEQLLQQIWRFQRIQRDSLRSTTGHRVRVLHPGFWNREAGPDFKGAIIQFDQTAPVSGDIEIDLTPNGWQDHRHDINPDYAQVVLHVVWTAPSAPPPPSIPVLALDLSLDASLPELETSLQNDHAEPAYLKGHCAAPFQSLPQETALQLLQGAGLARFHRKGQALQARARQAGWDQTLLEALFAALGYKNNTWPMRSLAETIPRLNTLPLISPLHWQAFLLGLSGLLPHQLPSRSLRIREYLRQVWDIWWRNREALLPFALPRHIWRLHNLRPANHPVRRLALGAHWLSRSSELPDAIEEWFAKEDSTAREQAIQLLQVLQVTDDPFWSWHWTFRTHRLPQAQPLLGPQRLTDLAVNAVLPWLWARAAAGKRSSLQHRAEHHFLSWPAGEDNAQLKLGRVRLFAEPAPALALASQQQGVLEILRDFCSHSNALCHNCGFPSLVQSVLPLH